MGMYFFINKAEWVPEIRFSVTTWNAAEKWLFSSFFAKFLPNFDDFSKPSVCITLKNHQIWHKFSKKPKKSLVQLAFNPFLGVILVPESYQH